MVLADQAVARQKQESGVKHSGGDLYRRDFDALGTHCTMLYGCGSRGRAEAFAKAARSWVEEFEEKYSRFKPDSLISRINAAAGREPVVIDGELERIFSLCDWFYWVTGGAFDPSSLPVLSLWDYHGEMTHVPDDASVARAVALTGWDKVRRDGDTVFLPQHGMGIDIGGIGKEYAVDRILELALESGIADVMVNFGNDIRAAGSPPEGGAWRIGIEEHSDPGKCWGGIVVENRAVASSGNYLRTINVGGRSFGHILDPRTGYPVDNGVRQTTVVAPTCAEAGVLSTTMFVMGVKAGMGLLERCHQAEGCVVTEGHRHETTGFFRYLL